MTMAGSPLDGSESPNPRDPTDDPLGPYTSRVTTMDTVLGVVFDDPERFIDAVFSDVNDLSEEERFQRSIAVLERHVEAEFGSVEALESALTIQDVPDALRRTLQELLDDTIEHVFFVREPLGTLVATAAYAVTLEALNAAERPEPGVDEEQAQSIAIALLARIHEGGSREAIDKNWLETLAHDVDVGGTILFGSEENWQIEGVDSLAKTRIVGAAIAYVELDISVSRGAELANTSVDDFEAVLESFDIRPRYGPEAADDIEGPLFDDE